LFIQIGIAIGIEIELSLRRCFCRGGPLWLPISRAATGGRPYNTDPLFPEKSICARLRCNGRGQPFMLRRGV